MSGWWSAASEENGGNPWFPASAWKLIFPRFRLALLQLAVEPTHFTITNEA